MTLPSLTITLLTTSCGGNVPRSHTRRLQTWLLASGWRAAPLGTHTDDLRPGYVVFLVFQCSVYHSLSSHTLRLFYFKVCMKLSMAAFLSSERGATHFSRRHYVRRRIEHSKPQAHHNSNPSTSRYGTTRSFTSKVNVSRGALQKRKN